MNQIPKNHIGIGKMFFCFVFFVVFLLVPQLVSAESGRCECIWEATCTAQVAGDNSDYYGGEVVDGVLTKRGGYGFRFDQEASTGQTIGGIVSQIGFEGCFWFAGSPPDVLEGLVINAADLCGDVSLEHSVSGDAERDGAPLVAETSYTVRCSVATGPERATDDGDIDGDISGSMSRVAQALRGLNKFPGATPVILFGRLTTFWIGIIGVAALGMFIYAGLLWMLSGGNAERQKKALQIMMWTSLGIVATLASYSILSFVFEAFG